jgi:hypothetical protein
MIKTRTFVVLTGTIKNGKILTKEIEMYVLLGYYIDGSGTPEIRFYTEAEYQKLIADLIELRQYLEIKVYHIENLENHPLLIEG